MAWRVARSIPVFHQQLKAAAPRAVPPGTPASSWGTIGDVLHDSTSDHAPKDFPGWGNDIVTAGDQPHAPHLGLDQNIVGESLRLSRDPRLKYWIFNRRMFSSYASSGYPAWTWRPYRGSDPHDTHSHLSVVGDARADGTQPWAIGIGDDMGQADDRSPFMDGRLYAIAHGLDEVPADHPAFKDFNGGEDNWLVKTVKALTVKVDSLALGDIDPAVLTAAVKRAVAEALQDPAVVASLVEAARQGANAAEDS
jgi:hypothetical protein